MDSDDDPVQGRTIECLVLATACVLPTFVTLVYFVWADGAATGVQQSIFAGMKVIQFALPVVWVGLFCGEPLLKPALLWPKLNGPGVGLGMAFGLAIATAIAGLYFALLGTDLLTEGMEAIRARIASIGIASPARFLAVGVFYALVHSFLEEYYWRWFVFGRLRRWLSTRLAITISAAAFALHHVVVLWAYFAHVPVVALGLSACVAVGGAFWAWLYNRSGSLYGPWISHLLVDAAIFAVGYHMARPLFDAV